mgnify:CR=1 FL=1
MMKQGSSRFGNDFETKCREFLAKYGYYILSENQIVNCETEGHKKPSHEVDAIVVASGLGAVPNPPVYGPKSVEKFAVSCKGGVPLNQEEIDEFAKQIECIQKDPRYIDLRSGLIMCQDKELKLKIPPNIYIWDRTFIHLLVEKIKVARFTKNSTQGGEFRVGNISMLWNFSISQPGGQAGEMKMTISLFLFNEDPEKSVGKFEIKGLGEALEDSAARLGVKGSQKFLSVYSAAGINTDLLSMKGTFDPADKTFFYSKMADLSLATWIPSLDEYFF